MPRRIARDPVYFDNGIPANTYEGAPIRMLCPLDPSRIDVFLSNEHYFHAKKVTLVNTDEDVLLETYYKQILTAKKPLQAKRLGRALPLSKAALALWDDYLAPVTMFECNIGKYRQHEHCRGWLVNTSNRPLVEHRPDPIWGDNLDGTGRNQLGKILEVVRAMVR